jgi:hypothetical protein
MNKEETAYIAYLTNLFDTVDFWFLILTVPLGVVLNLFAIYVFSRPNLNKTTMGFFYMNLSGWTAAVLLYFFFVQNSAKTMKYDITKYTPLGCAFYMFIRRVIREVPPWIEVLITIDRFIAVCHPTKFKFMKNKLVLLGLIFGTIVCLGILSYQNFDYTLIYSYKNTTVFDQTTNSTIYKNVVSKVSCSQDIYGRFYADIVSAILRAVAPAIVLMIFSILLVKKVLDSKKSLQKESGKTDKASAQFTRSVLNMNIIFWALNVPESIVYFIKNFYNITTSADPYIVGIINNSYTFSYVIANLYYNLKFFSYLFFNKLFFKEILIILKLDKPSIASTMNKPTKETK